VNTSPDDVLAELLVKWEDAWDQGEELSAAELCGEQIDLVEPLQKNINKLKQSSWMKNDPASEDYEPHDEPPLTGTLANRYRIDSLIGEGGHGRVYKAFDNELQRYVAIKVAITLRPTPDLLDEARRVAKLRHPNIVTILDVGREDEKLFIVSELIDGQTLADLITEDTAVRADRVAMIASIADALQYAHDNGFVHRDIKPSNLLIDSKGQPHVADFGIAASLDDVTDGRASTSGTLAYMSPEQLAGEFQLIDHRTDIYALGVVLFEALTGRLPYKARTPQALREQILFRPPTSLRETLPDASAELESICNRCLAKHPADRFATAAELAHSLKEVKSVGQSSFNWKLVGVTTLSVAIFSLLLSGVWTWFSRNDDSFVAGGVMRFDGRTRVVTNLERTLPVTLEAWVRPDQYKDEYCQFFIGSDIPGKYGCGIGVCGSVLSAEYISGMIKSDAAIVPRRWSHFAGVFTDTETRLYLDGKLIVTGPGSSNDDSTVFVIGSVGLNNYLDYFRGQIRSVRISEGERYHDEFEPQELRKDDKSNLFISSPTVRDNKLFDTSGEMIGQIERLGID